MVTERQLRRVVENAGYSILSLEMGRHYKLHVSDRNGRTTKLVVSQSPRSQSHWPHFVLADLKRKMR